MPSVARQEVRFTEVHLCISFFSVHNVIRTTICALCVWANLICCLLFSPISGQAYKDGQCRNTTDDEEEAEDEVNDEDATGDICTGENRAGSNANDDDVVTLNEINGENASLHSKSTRAKIDQRKKQQIALAAAASDAINEVNLIEEAIEEVTNEDVSNATASAIKGSQITSGAGVKLGIGKKLRFNLKQRPQGGPASSNLLAPESQKKQQLSSTTESSTSETLANTNQGRSLSAADATSTLNGNNSTATSQVMARRGKREKASAKRERKATKTLAIVLGKNLRRKKPSLDQEGNFCAQKEPFFLVEGRLLAPTCTLFIAGDAFSPLPVQ